ncbi:hypothetical protein EWM64_g7130 [Hericium alpestre]|uniref:Uncharacterized protein n=1 Tax=Hericium alpestre TaxID=135208 RepID=A0A4Y9ZS66_9AGAM|nr:hypothetical protein EWM64_g7130 [Hericium alpestre]
MAWWKVVWSPEEVGWRVRAAVRAGWAELERAVLPSLSTLPQTQARLTDLTLSRLPAPPSPLASPVLQNALDQLRTAPTYAVRPTALLAPLSGRRNVLENGVTGALERAAQGLALRVFGSTGAGLGAGGVWIAWKEGAEWLVGSSAGDAAMSAAADAVQLSQTVGTGAGVGLLIALGGTRWAIGKWERAKKDWWGGWRRTAAGGERDMRTTLELALDQQVLVVPARASRGLQGLAERRAEEVKNLSSRLDELS